MSLQSWIDEFYPTPASQATEENAVEHSLQKWTGLLPENLEKHGVVLQGAVFDPAIPDEWFSFNARTCALCEIYMEPDLAGEPVCGRCPLAKAGKECSGPEGNPWTHWLRTSDPEPMIQALGDLL